LHTGLQTPHCYLEIGVEAGETLQRITFAERFGVDPEPQFDTAHLPNGIRFFTQTSDEFFDQLGPEVKFDLAFIDGLHTFEQTYRDVINSLSHVPRGPILIDDTVPDCEASGIPDRALARSRLAELGDYSGRWHGDVWKVVVALKWFHPEIELLTIRDDNCQTIIWRRETNCDIVKVTTEMLARVNDLTYREVFTEGIPKSFMPVSETEAIASCLDALKTRF
jgi:hypothetical protein